MGKINLAKNALVRDYIPNIIESKGCDCTYRVIDDDIVYKSLLKHKLEEEAHEVYVAQTKEEVMEELADCLEVMDCIAKFYGINMQDVKDIKTKKLLEKGSFNERIFLSFYEKEID